MNELIQDVRFALRQMRRSPNFVVVAIATLALGIGANTAIFSVIEAVILRPLPYHDTDHLVLLKDAQDLENGGFLYKDYEYLQSQSKTLADSAIYYRNSGFSRVTLNDEIDPAFVQGAFVSANFFPLMGVAPEMGRVFSSDEETSQIHILVLSHSLWMHRFGASREVLGKTLRINGINSQIIGVMPETFQFPASDQQFWAPISTNPHWADPALTKMDANTARGFYARWQIISRLKPRVNLAQAQVEISTLFERLAKVDHDPNRSVGIKVAPLQVNPGENTWRVLIVLFAAVLFVLLIACTNIANLVLARGESRRNEMTMRISLGASRQRLFRQLLTESVLLAFISGILGLIVAYFGLHIALGFAPSGIPRLAETRLDGYVLVFTLSICVLSAVLFGLAPAWRFSRTAQALRSERDSTCDRNAKRTHGWLIVAEFALTVVLLAGAGLLIRSFVSVQGVNLGFEPAQVLTINVVPSSNSATSRNVLYNSLYERDLKVPGVQAVGAIDGLFETATLHDLGLRAIEGRSPEPKQQWTPLQWNSVRGDFFAAMGIRLLRGRYFTQEDSSGSPLVALIDESMARRYWPNENPLGKRFKGQDQRGKNDDWITVVGIVSDTHRSGLERSFVPHVYEPYTQAIDGDKTPDLVVRFAGNSSQLAPVLRNLAHQLDAGAILSSATSLDEQLWEQLSSRRFQTLLLTLFSLVALLLATLGIYGVLSYSVAQRTHEIGIRIALGARHGQVLRLVIGEGAKLAMVGLMIGLVSAGGMTKYIASLLFGVSATDPVTFISAGLLLMIVGLVACYIPARRATKVEPMAALRYE